MKRTLVISLLSCTLLAACAPSKRQKTSFAPYPRDVEPGVDMVAPPGDTVPGTAVEPAPEPSAPKQAPVTTANVPPVKREARYGLPEPGKLGMMRSPYHPEAGLIDYRGLPPGTEVKDPYTPGKIILVP